MLAGHILAVNQVDHPGGAEIGLLRLLPALQAAGWSVTFTTPGAGPLREAAGKAGANEVAELPVGGLERGSGARAVMSWRAARRLSRDSDLVYLNGTVAARLLPAMRRRRTLLHVHDIVDRVPRFWRAADLVLADSTAAAQALGDLPAHVVGCPVDPDPRIVSAPWGAAAHEGGAAPVIGFVGRIEPRKGPLDLVLAAPMIRERSPGARVVLVGDDPYNCDPAYALAVAAAVAADEGVSHVGWSDDAAGLMRHLDVLVAPSRREPFGTVLAEAMSVGTPVVATRVDGLAETVRDGHTGLLVPAPVTPEAIASAVSEVLAARERMGAAARVHAQRFHTPAYAARVTALLRECVA